MNKNVFQPIAYALLLIIGIQLGYKLNSTLHKGKNPFNATYSTANGSPNQAVEEVFQYINAKYVDTINTGDLATNVIKNTLTKLDPHSSYISAKELSVSNADLAGKFDGIGIEFSVIEDTVLVVTPISGGPSETVGIMPGDKIVKVNDSLIVGNELNTDVVMSLFRGKKGTKVELDIKRGKLPDLLAFTVTRDEIPLTSVDIGYMLNEKTGYIKVSSFSSKTYNEFGAELYELTEAGMKNLILDLRGNLGGYLDAATNMLDELIPGKEILVYTEGRNHRRRNYISKVTGLFETNNIAVLIDEGSASAAEIMAGAIQDLDRGILIGRRTFGKGFVQEHIELSDGSAMRLTVARYHTPSGRCIQKPYTKGDSKNYNNEIVNRYENGEVYNNHKVTNSELADSLKFRTRYGRQVYGGGGIAPDFHYPIDTTQTVGFYRLRSMVPEFVYNYFSDKQSEFEQYENVNEFDKNYQISASLINSFKTFVDKEKVKYELNDLTKYNTELTTYIKAYIARQRWGNEGFYPIYNHLDKTLKQAVIKVEKLDMRNFISGELDAMAE